MPDLRLRLIIEDPERSEDRIRGAVSVGRRSPSGVGAGFGRCYRGAARRSALDYAMRYCLASLGINLRFIANADLGSLRLCRGKRGWPRIFFLLLIIGDPERSEDRLRGAVSVGRRSPSGVGDGLWAMLSGRRSESGARPGLTIRIYNIFRAFSRKLNMNIFIKYQNKTR